MTCFVHESIIWLKKGKNRAHFSDKENAELFQSDLNMYKICPFVPLLPHLREAMITKRWHVPISEPVAAEKWIVLGETKGLPWWKQMRTVLLVAASHQTTTPLKAA
jgi:hypothetical protein